MPAKIVNHEKVHSQYLSRQCAEQREIRNEGKPVRPIIEKTVLSHAARMPPDESDRDRVRRLKQMFKASRVPGSSFKQMREEPKRKADKTESSNEEIPQRSFLEDENGVKDKVRDLAFDIMSIPVENEKKKAKLKKNLSHNKVIVRYIDNHTINTVIKWYYSGSELAQFMIEYAREIHKAHISSETLQEPLKESSQETKEIKEEN